MDKGSKNSTNTGSKGNTFGGNQSRARKILPMFLSASLGIAITIAISSVFPGGIAAVAALSALCGIGFTTTLMLMYKTYQNISGKKYQSKLENDEQSDYKSNEKAQEEDIDHSINNKKTNQNERTEAPKQTHDDEEEPDKDGSLDYGERRYNKQQSPSYSPRNNNNYRNSPAHEYGGNYTPHPDVYGGGYAPPPPAFHPFGYGGGYAPPHPAFPPFGYGGGYAPPPPAPYYGPFPNQNLQRNPNVDLRDASHRQSTQGQLQNP